MVKDLEESLRFYQEIIGLPLSRRFQAGPDTEIAFLGDGETQIELICNQAKKEINAGQDISWCFEVDSLDRMMEFVREKGVEILDGPFQPNPHVKFFHVLDPNGMKIQLAENL
jgi:Predicted enzyme related to lactoylglutathione lyase